MHTLTRHPRTVHPPDITPEFSPPPLPRAEAPRTVEVAGSRLTVFVESPPLFDSMERDIRNAKSRIWVEVYIFYNDQGATRIAEALKAKAREGLEVRVLYDALGSASTPSAFFNDLIAAGIEVHAFHSFWESLRRFRPFTLLNRRNHRKLMIIDDAVGYFGGMNIIDNVEDVKQQKEEDRPASSGWRDVHVRLEGPHQSELAESFDRSWRRAHGEQVPRRPRAYRRALHLNGLSNGSTEPVPESIRFFDSGPGFKYSRAARVFTKLIRHAQFQITISMAYFIPTGKTLRALLAARRRGARIRIIVPGKSDVPIVQRATSFLYDKLIRRGFRIYERRQQMLHSKTMIVDGHYTIVGSCNLDPRSLYINLEFLAVIRSRRFAEILRDICKFEIANSERITLARCQQVPRMQRVFNYLAWSLRWWL
ncbi:MAG: phospholipase D-like domain-containing protein [Phycisphaerae bacterium]